jgi:hypothetical protein
LPAGLTGFSLAGSVLLARLCATSIRGIPVLMASAAVSAAPGRAALLPPSCVGPVAGGRNQIHGVDGAWMLTVVGRRRSPPGPAGRHQAAVAVDVGQPVVTILP